LNQSPETITSIERPPMEIVAIDCLADFIIAMREKERSELNPEKSIFQVRQPGKSLPQTA
jgi:hypothetical protein